MDIILKSGSSEDLNLVSGSSIIHVGESIISLSGSNFVNMVEVSYSYLVSLRDSSGLTPGFYYRIIDYVTVSVEDYSRSVYHGFDVIVLALNDHELCEDAYACVRDGEEDGYFSGNTLSAWKLKYCLDNDRDRFAWACPDDGAIQVKELLIKPFKWSHGFVLNESVEYVNKRLALFGNKVLLT